MGFERSGVAARGMRVRHQRHPDGKRLRDQHPDAVRDLGRLKNAGHATVEDLLVLGVFTVEDLARRDPDEMYREMCRIDGVEHSMHVRDVYASLVDQARGGAGRPWFDYTRERKQAQLARRRENEGGAGRVGAGPSTADAAPARQEREKTEGEGA